jgi:hypothetical protein
MKESDGGGRRDIKLHTQAARGACKRNAEELRLRNATIYSAFRRTLMRFGRLAGHWRNVNREKSVLARPQTRSLFFSHFSFGICRPESYFCECKKPCTFWSENVICHKSQTRWGPSNVVSQFTSYTREFNSRFLRTSRELESRQKHRTLARFPFPRERRAVLP